MNIKRSTKPKSQKKLFDDKEVKQDVEETLGKERRELEKKIDKTISKIREWRERNDS